MLENLARSSVFNHCAIGQHHYAVAPIGGEIDIVRDYEQSASLHGQRPHKLP